MDKKDYIEFIKFAFFSKENQRRKEAEENLFKMLLKDESGMILLFEILLSEQEETILQATAQTVNTYIKKLITYIQPYPHAKRMQHVELILQALKGRSSSQVKSSITLGLESLISYDKENYFTSRLITHMAQSIQTKDLQCIEQALYIASAILKASHSNQLSFDWLEPVFMAGLLDLSDLIPFWCQVIRQICEKFLVKKPSSAVVKFFIHNQTFCEALKRNLNFSDQMQFKKEQEHLLVCYNLIYNQFGPSCLSAKLDIEYSPFYQFIEIGINYLLTTLMVISQKHDLLSLPSEGREVIVMIIKILATCCQLNRLYSLFEQYRPHVLLEIIYPLLHDQPEDADQIYQDPAEYINHVLDAINEQKGDTLKTSCSQLIQSFCNYIDGSVTYFVQIVSLVCQYSNGSGQLCDLLANLQKYQPKQMIMVSIFILCVMSHNLMKRPELVGFAKSVIEAPFVREIKDAQIRAIHILLIGCYIPLYLKTKLDIKPLINYLLLQIQPGKAQPQIVTYACVEAFALMFEDQDNQSHLDHKNDLEALARELLVPLCQTLKDSDIATHFELIKTLFTNYAKSIPELTLLLGINSIVSKILCEQQALEQGRAEKQIIINYSWNILKLIPAKVELCTLGKIEESVYPLYEQLQQPKYIDYEEDIFVFVTQIIERLGYISEFQVKVLIYCPIVLAKQRERLGQMFEMFNYYIIHGNQIFKDQQILEVFLGMMSNVMSEENENNSEADQAEGALLLQLLMQYHCRQLSIESLVKIFNIVLQRTKQPIKNDFLKTALVGVFLSGLMVDVERCSGIVAQLNIFKEIIESVRYQQQGYDTKLYVNTVCLLINASPQILTMELLSCLLDLLIKQHRYEQEMLEKDDDDADDMFEFDEDKEEFKMSMNVFKSELKQVDEFRTFQQTFEYLKQMQDNEQLARKAFEQAQFTPLIKQQLATVLRVRRICETPREIITVMRRKEPKELADKKV